MLMLSWKLWLSCVNGKTVLISISNQLLTVIAMFTIKYVIQMRSYSNFKLKLCLPISSVYSISEGQKSRSKERLYSTLPERINKAVSRLWSKSWRHAYVITALTSASKSPEMTTRAGIFRRHQTSNNNHT